MRLSRIVVLVAVVSVSLTGTVGASAHPRHPRDTEVSVGSPATPFTQNKQNEPAVAIDPTRPWLVVEGNNDLIDFESCAAGDPTTCPFTAGVGQSGVSFSTNGGRTWTQPTYTGWSARHCLGPEECQPKMGPIGTVPNHVENGMVTFGDPSVAFGPRPGPGGEFAWSNGSRLYYNGMVLPFPGNPGFQGSAAITVSHLDASGPGNRLADAIAGDNDAWSDPVVVTDQQTDEQHSYKPMVWADNAATSPHFGNVYACGSAADHELPPDEQPIQLARSTDGGVTWQAQEISPPSDNTAIGCMIRTDSQGVVYVVWIGNDTLASDGSGEFLQARSFDGGVTFEEPRAIVEVAGIGGDDPVLGGPTMDGIAGAQNHRLPHIDIANGAPTGTDATDEILLTWVDNSAGMNREKAYLVHSIDGGETYTGRRVVSAPFGRANFPAVAISPDGKDIYLVHNVLLAPWRTSLAPARPMTAVVRHATSFTGRFKTLHRGAIGDTRAASSNGMTNGFYGDYNFVAATRYGAFAAWNDLRDADVCPAVNAYRQSLADGSPIPRPAPGTDCPDRFGNTDTWGIAVPDPFWRR